MFCHRCGKRLVRDALFCSYCGARVVLPEEEPDVPVAPESAPKSEPVRAAVPKPEPEPIPEPVPEQESIPAPEPEPEPDPEPEPEPIDVQVKTQQLKYGERIVVRDERLENPIRIRLTPAMKDGSMLKLTTASGKQVLARICVVDPEPAQPQTVQSAPKSAVSAQPAPKPAAPAPTRTAAITEPVTVRCTFQFNSDGKLKTGYKFGGNEEGGVVIYPDRIVVHKKSKTLNLAGGMIASALQGIGSEFVTIRREQIASCTVNNNTRGEPFSCSVILKDGSLLYVWANAAGLRTLDRFCSM